MVGAWGRAKPENFPQHSRLDNDLGTASSARSHTGPFQHVTHLAFAALSSLVLPLGLHDQMVWIHTSGEMAEVGGVLPRKHPRDRVGSAHSH